MKPPDRPAIRAAGLRKRFGSKDAVRDLSFTVPMGAVAGFLGPNGAGKTTTLRLLLGLIPADGGEMEVLGYPIPGHGHLAREQVGAIVELPSFLESMTGRENLWWFGSLYQPVTESRVDEVLDLVGLRDAGNQTFGTYSLGMKQRLGVGSALLHRPTLMILDEPTNGMDPQGRAHMREVFKNIHAAEGTTIFLSSHLLDEVQRLCDYIVIIDHGKTMKEGFMSDLPTGDRENWEIRVPDAQVARAKELLAGRPEVVSLEVGPRGLLVGLTGRSSAAVNRFLLESGMEVTALIPIETSLEDTFLELTDSRGN